MVQPGQRQTKKQKKALAFRTRQKVGKKNNKAPNDEDVLGFPIDENQDLAGLAGFPLEAEEVSAGDRQGDRKGKAQDTGHHQAQLPDGSKKRKRGGEDVLQEKPQKKSKAQSVALEPGVEDGDHQKAVELKKGVQPQRFILFIGTPRFRFCVATLIERDCRQFEIFHHKGRHSCSLLLVRYDALRA